MEFKKWFSDMNEMMIEREHDFLEDNGLEGCESIGVLDEEDRDLFEWRTDRDYEYLTDIKQIHEEIGQIEKEIKEGHDQRVVHRSKKQLEMLIRRIRQEKKKVAEDKNETDKMIAYLDDFLSVCDNLREK